MPGRFYVTTPIYYVNDVPHLGTAYTTVTADALRRFHLLAGDETRMLTGTDEHGQKIQEAATARGVSPQVFVDEVSARFREAWPQLSVASDDFIRTTEPRHIAFVQELWKAIAARGDDLYPGVYDEWYCVGCESYKTEKELLPGNVCAIHLKPVERIKEDTYFFRLSRWEKPLLDFYQRHPGFIQPESRRNEVLSFVQSGLRDLSVSRTSFQWGIPVPGDQKHIMYVWFDALANYRSALGHDAELTKFWPPGGRLVHLVGKDILRFHAVYWPAFLLAAGYPEEALPSQVFAHGFLTVDGQKMSKSLRNAVDPLKLAKELGPDVLRYYLLRAIAFGQDGDFDHKALLERYNADLGKNIGNLLSRVLGLCSRFPADRGTPRLGEERARTFTEDIDVELARAANEALAKARASWEEIAPHRALEAATELASAGNLYVDRAAPWALAKGSNWERLQEVLAALLGVLEAVSVLVWPAMPSKSDEMRRQLGLDPLAPATGRDQWPHTFAARTSAAPLAAPTPLFPTFDKAAEAALLAKLMPPAMTEKTTENADPPANPTGDTVPRIKVATPVSAAPDSPAPVTSPQVTYDDFARIDLRIGLVTAAEKVPKKDKLLKLAVDLGEGDLRQIVAGLALTFAPEALVGRRVIVVANLAPRDFGKGLVSHGMLLATGPSEALILASAPDDAAPGARLK